MINSQRACKGSSSSPSPPGTPCTQSPGWPLALLAPEAPYIDGLPIDVTADRGSRGRGVGHCASACLADVDLRGGDFQSSAGHLRRKTTSPFRERVSWGLGCLSSKTGLGFTSTGKKTISANYNSTETGML